LTELPDRVDVLVAGAGPAGSATATLLAREGYAVLALDRAAFPREKPCAEYMSPEAVRILSRLGVVEALETAGAVALEGMKITASRGARAHGRFAEARHPVYRPTGLAVSRKILDYELVQAARAAGALVRERTSVEELLYQHGELVGARARDQHGKQHVIHARLVIGADGLRSLTARRMGGRIYGKPRRLAFVAHMAGVERLDSSAELHFGRTAYVGLNRISRDHANVAIVVPQQAAAAARGRVEDFFFHMLAQFPEVSSRIRASRLVRPVLVTGPFAVRSRCVTAPGSLLVGDAADFFDPVTGDGIYSALRGAELVAETMVPALRTPDPVSPVDLRRYRHLRRRVFVGKWIMERVTRYMMCSPRFFDRSILRLGRNAHMAHTAVGVAGGFVPVRELFKPTFIARVLF
jgi:flavin-dependent dehydrogenase